MRRFGPACLCLACWQISLLRLALLLTLVAGGGLRAQEASTGAPPSGAEAPVRPHSHAQDLIRILEDEGARQALIDALRKGQVPSDAAPAPPSAPPTPQADEPAAAEGVPADPTEPPPDPPVSVGQRLINWASSFAEGAARRVEEDYAAGRANIRRLGTLGHADWDQFRSFLPEILRLMVVGIASAYVMRVLVRPFLARLGARAVGTGPVRKVLIAFLGAAIDLLAMLMAAAITLAVDYAYQSDPGSAIIRTTFLASFVVAAFLIVALRLILSPATPHMRALPMTDRTASGWTRHLIVVIVLLTFVEVFGSSIVQEISSRVAANAFVVLVNVVAIVYLSLVVYLNRRGPEAFVERRLAADPENLWLILAAGIVPWWRVAAYVYFVFLFHQAVTAGGAGIPVLVDTAQIALALALGLSAIETLRRVSDRGLRLSDTLRGAFPTLEARINVFAPHFLRFVRWSLFVVWVVFVLQVIGVIALWDVAEERFGIDILGAATSLVLVALVAFVAWLIVTGWIDYRLTPHHGHVPTPRERTLLALLRNAALIAILLFVLVSSLAEVGVSVAPLLASAGVVGLAIGFGSQKLVQDIITGLFIQFENAINVGDVIEAGGKIGTVEKLTIRSVSLRDVQGVFHVIPFSSVDLVSNHMMGFSHHVADIGIAYHEDIDAAKGQMLAAYDDLMADPIWSTKLLGGIEWFGVQELAQSAVILRVRLKTRPGEQWAVGRAYTELVKKRFDAAGIEIPFPHMTLRLGAQKDGTAARPRAAVQTLRAEGPTDADAAGGGPGDAEADTPR